MNENQDTQGLPVVAILHNAFLISLRFRSIICKALPVLIVCVGFAMPLLAGQGLKTIKNPQGGMIVYGQVDGHTTEAGAMGKVLRSLQNQYGDRPEVGRVFKVRDTNSFAVFFTLVKRNQGNVKVAGMLIASRFAPNHIEAALVTDDAARFGSTVNPMLSKLFSVWHPPGREAPSSASTEGRRFAPSAALNQVVLPDRSASVGLPAGWKIISRISGGGTIVAIGPRKELVQLNATFFALNSIDPHVQQTKRLNQKYGYRDTQIYYPYGGNLAKTFVDIYNLSNRQQNLPPVSFKISSAEPVPATRSQRCTHLTGTATPDQAGGQGVLEVYYCTTPPISGSWLSSAFITNVPSKVADEERATVRAIVQSFRVDMNVVNRQAAAIAQPAIDAINAFGAAALRRGAETSAANERYNRAWEKGQDSQARHNKAFSNYLLDQSVVRDNEQNAHGTAWNKTADSLVRSNPQRYEYVNTADFRKGIDY